MFLDRHLEQALVAVKAAQWTQAEKLLNDILAGNPRQADALHLSGIVRRERGQHAAAVEALTQAISANPDVAQFHVTLGETFLQKDQFHLGQTHFREALHLEGTNVAAWFGLGRARFGLGELERAAEAFAQVVDLAPQLAEGHLNLGLCWIGLEKWDDAVTSLNKARILSPGNRNIQMQWAIARGQQAKSLHERGQLLEAVLAYRDSVGVNPNDRHLHSNLSAALRGLGRYLEGEQAARAAMVLDPNFVPARLNLGGCYYDQGNFELAEAEFRRAIKIDTTNILAHLNLGQLLLLTGRSEEGWKEFEWRWFDPDFMGRGFSQPRWKGQKASTAHLLVHAEQGLGDAIQFLRYLPKVRSLVARLTLEVPPSLVGLCKNFPGVDQVVARGGALPEFDLECPLMSLAMLFPGDVPPAPYLARPKNAFVLPGPNNYLKVGLVWAGNPAHANDRNRSIPLAIVAPLTDLKRATIYSFQLGKAAEMVDDLGPKAVDLAPRLIDWQDTAAALLELDLLITVDTAIAHLAGALNVPTWLMLPFVPDWRWGLSGVTTHWYPSLRIYRQDKPMNWVGVMLQLVQDLMVLRDEKTNLNSATANV